MLVSLITSVPLNPPWDQGDKNLAYLLTQHLPQHDFRVLTHKDRSPPTGRNLELRPAFGSDGTSIRKDKWRVFRSLLTQKRSSDPSLYHLIYQPFPLSSILARCLPALRRKPVIHTIPATAHAMRFHRLLFYGSVTVAMTEFGREILSSAGAPSVRYIPHGIDLVSWSSLRYETEFYKVQLGLKGRRVILFPGHYGPHYGANQVLEILPNLAQRMPDVIVLFACRPRDAADGERELGARRWLAEQGVAHAARFYRTVADMRPLIAAADLTVLPLTRMHHKLDIPTTLLESLAAGKGIVVADLPPINELVTSGAHGVGKAVPPGDAPALMQAITEMLNDPVRLQDVGDRAQELVHSCYDIRHVATRYAELYREVIG